MAIVRGSELRGIAFPISKGREGYWPRRNSKALRRTSIINILGTIPGERVGVPGFGSNLYALMFEPNDDILQQQIREETAGALARWDPLIKVMGVATDFRDNSINIFIDYIDITDQKREVRRSVFSTLRS